MKSLGEIEQLVRETIERQVETTPCGLILVACDPLAVKRLVTNIVGNLTMVVADALEVES